MPLSQSEFSAFHRLTQQTDYGSLCSCLIESLAVIAPDSDYALLEVYDDRGQSAWQEVKMENLVVRQFPSPETLPHPPWLKSAIKADTTQGGLARQSFEETDIVCFGRLHGVWRFLTLTGGQALGTESATWQLAVIFANLIRLIDRFERDPLTGLFNRQSFDERFEDLIEYQQQNPKRERTTHNVWLAIADIDHFKRINDGHGHLFGDEILLLVSQIMRDSFRFDDLLFRYGGEEFVVILNNTDEAGASLALQRLRLAIREYDFPRIERLTMSIGWTAVGKHEFATTIIDRADKALYHAKEQGRDRVISFENEFGEFAGGKSAKS